MLRPDSLACDVFGREAVTSVLTDFFDRGSAPVQVVGALFVYERYHQRLAGYLSAARATGANDEVRAC
mgnify:CR=1 FL=1